MTVAAAVHRWWDSDLVYDFRHSPVAIIAGAAGDARSDRRGGRREP